MFGVAGSGKSTILKLALGLLKPDRGHIYTLGEDVTQMREEQLFDLRRKVGIVFQESALFDSLTVRENVAFRLMEEGEVSDDEIDERVREALSFVELEHTVDMFPVGTLGRNAPPRGDCPRHHHPTRDAALRFSDWRTRSCDFHDHHGIDREAARRLQDQFAAGHASPAGRVHHGNALLRPQGQ